jgi:peptidoglycan/xylan/chitin deacetylase (PgdA/CDA1 family)
MLLEISLDDGCKEDFFTLGLLERYGLREYATAYIAPERPGAISPDEIKELSKLVEVGGHTLTHALLTRLPKEEQMYQLETGREELQDITGQKIERFCYPKGWFNTEVMISVAQAGFTSGRTMNLGKTSLNGYTAFNRPVTAHIYPRAEYGGDIVGSIKRLFGKEYFGLVLHSWEVQKIGMWKETEEIFKFIYENKSAITGKA